MDPIFLKLGGSAITDKTRDATAREDVIRSAARQVCEARRIRPDLALVLGHGSGSFGHFAAKKWGFREPERWQAYAETGAAAARLNRLVADLFLADGVPVVSIQPSASACCRDGRLIDMAVTPIEAALAHGLVPLVYGDVAFDTVRGRWIASTEMIFEYLAPRLKPAFVVLAGNVDGVYTADPYHDDTAVLIPEITPRNVEGIKARLRGSHGVDVTGGMFSKVLTMVALVERQPQTCVRLVSALRAGAIVNALTGENDAMGTTIRA